MPKVHARTNTQNVVGKGRTPDRSRGDLYAYLGARITIDEDTGCWLWTGALTQQGYAQSAHDRGAHRMIYALLRGTIPPHRDLHHRCHVKRCVNPDHLELITRSDHMRLHAEERRSITA